MLNGMVREGRSEKFRYEPRFEKGGKGGVSHGVSVGKMFQGEGTASAKALYLEHSWQVWVGGQWRWE